jgi:anthranilate synthase component 1
VVRASPRSWCVRSTRPRAQKVTIRPLAGTRPRGATPEAGQGDRAAELMADPKERAEHVMLIDLARNDIGRIAKTAA